MDQRMVWPPPFLLRNPVRCPQTGLLDCRFTSIWPCMPSPGDVRDERAMMLTLLQKKVNPRFSLIPSLRVLGAQCLWLRQLLVRSLNCQQQPELLAVARNLGGMLVLQAMKELPACRLPQSSDLALGRQHCSIARTCSTPRPCAPRHHFLNARHHLIHSTQHCA